MMLMESEKVVKDACILATMFERAVLRKAAAEVRIAEVQPELAAQGGSAGDVRTPGTGAGPPVTSRKSICQALTQSSMHGELSAI